MSHRDQSQDAHQELDSGEDPAAEASAQPPCIRFFRRGQNDQLLVAVVEPNKDFPAGIPVNKIKDWIRNQGCNSWFLNDETILQLSMEARRMKEAKEYVVAERKDCQVEVQVSPDRIQAWIRISPAFGGEPLTEALLRQALEEHHIRFGIKQAEFQHALQNGACERELIAEGIPPIQGQKAQFEPLVSESEHKGIPQERADGSVDYKDLGLYLSVTKGTPLLRRIAPTVGTPGKGVDGTSIPAPPGVDRPAHPGTGTAFSKEDPDLIVATRAGQPSFMDNSVRVDPTLEIETVNPSTGNVVFDGNVIVRGPVESGFTVQAGQDLTILDTVEGANLIAGRNLVLLTGVYGKGKTNISAEGNIEARFLSDCTVYCGGSIEVADLISHCTVECEGAVHLGKYGGKGQFFGGKLLALREVHAQILGSVSEAVTLVEIAPPRALTLRQDELDKDIAATAKELETVERQLHSTLSSSADQGNLRNGNLNGRSVALAQKLEELKKEQEGIREKMDARHKGKIRAAQVHRGVILCIGKLWQTVSDPIADLCFQMPVEANHPQ